MRIYEILWIPCKLRRHAHLRARGKDGSLQHSKCEIQSLNCLLTVQLILRAGQSECRKRTTHHLMKRRSPTMRNSCCLRGLHKGITRFIKKDNLEAITQRTSSCRRFVLAKLRDPKTTQDNRLHTNLRNLSINLAKRVQQQLRHLPTIKEDPTSPQRQQF